MMRRTHLKTLQHTHGLKEKVLKSSINIKISYLHLHNVKSFMIKGLDNEGMFRSFWLLCSELYKWKKRESEPQNRTDRMLEPQQVRTPAG